MSQHEKDHPGHGGKILIVGGYGQVGRAVAKRLAPQFLGRVCIAGRSLAKARAAAKEIGHRVEGRSLDLYSPDAVRSLEGVALVLVCLDQSDTGFVENCLSRGIHYLDVSANQAFLSRVEKLDDLARSSGAVGLLSVGTAPGLTNLLAARACEKLKRTERIDILVELGLGDRHGRAALEWMFDNLDAHYEVFDQGRLTRVRSFGERIDFRLPNETRARSAYRFNFSDQRAVGKTLDVPSASTWIRFDSRIATWVFSISARAGLGRLLRRQFWRRIAVWLFMRIHVGSDICAVAVQVQGQDAGGNTQVAVSVVGRKEALMTAIIAAEMARQVLAMKLPAGGVFHSDQVIALDPVVTALRKELPSLDVAL